MYTSIPTLSYSMPTIVYDKYLEGLHYSYSVPTTVNMKNTYS